MKTRIATDPSAEPEGLWMHHEDRDEANSLRTIGEERSEMERQRDRANPQEDRWLSGFQLMGILNVTPDSFFDGGRGHGIEWGNKLFREGADWVDVGGESTRPGSEPVDLEEELRRVIPVVEALSAVGLVSIDTMKVEVARQAVKAGASMINDVTGFRDPAMRELGAASGVRLCVMHMQGEPKSMQENPVYEGGVVSCLMEWFERRVKELVEAGVKEEQIILDPGIGFGKTTEHCLEIVRNLSAFRGLGFPILFGCSRKSFMTRVLDKPAGELLSATLAINTIALREGVDFLRVHDVAEHRDAVELVGRCM